MLRIAFNSNESVKNIPQQNIGNNTYVLPKKVYYTQLEAHCKKWLDINQDTTEEMYDHWLDLSINFNTSVLQISEALTKLVDNGCTSKIVQDLNKYSKDKTDLDFKLNMPESVLFTGDEKGFLRSFDSGNHSELRDFGRFHDWDVQSFTVSQDQKYLFASEYGYVYQVNTRDMVDFTFKKTDKQLKLREFKKVHDDKINTMCVCGENEFLFTADKLGNVKQIPQNDEVFIHSYDKAHQSMILQIRSTPNGKFVYSTCKDGHMKRLDVEKKDYSYDFGRIHDGYISGLCCTPDNKYVLTSGKMGHLKQWSVEDNEQVLDYGRVHDAAIISLEVTFDGKFVFTGDTFGSMKQWNQESMKMHRNYGKVHDYPISHISVSRNSKWIFSSDRQGFLKQFDINECVCVKDYGKIHEKSIFKFSCQPEVLHELSPKKNFEHA